VLVRPSAPQDAEAIAAVQVRSFQVGLADVHPAEALATLDPAPRVPLWRERDALVAEDGQGIVGVAEVGPSDEERVGEIYRFFVAPERWGEGVGQALMARALEQLRESGFPEALLWVHADNRRACGFYEAGGWRKDGTEKEQVAFGGPVKLVLYRIVLADRSS
jgi:GNAT superfamily N-acetyltransferase